MEERRAVEEEEKTDTEDALKKRQREGEREGGRGRKGIKGEEGKQKTNR